MSLTSTVIRGNLPPEDLAEQFTKMIDDLKPKSRVKVKGDKEGNVTFNCTNREGTNTRLLTKREIMEQYHGCTESDVSPKLRAILGGINADPQETLKETEERLRKKRQELPKVLVDEAVEFSDPIGSVVDNIAPPVEVPVTDEKFQI